MADTVSGMTKTVSDRGAGPGIDVAKASYDPGYPLGDSLPKDGFTAADLKYGYSDSLKATGNGR